MDACLETHSTAQIIRHFRIPLRGTITMGGHAALEKNIFDAYGSEINYWFECNPNVFPELEKRLSGDPRHQAIYACLWSENDIELDLKFFRNNSDGAASLYDVDKFYDFVPDCPATGESVKVKTSTFDSVATKHGIDISRINFLVCDLQGAEIEALKGASNLLLSPALEWIYCEVSWEAYYKGAPLIDEVIKYLADYGFLPQGLRPDTPGQGDLTFYRQRRYH